MLIMVWVNVDRQLRTTKLLARFPPAPGGMRGKEE